MKVNWSTKPHFRSEEFRCKHCGVEAMEESFMFKLEELRVTLGHPMVVTSGYRCPLHPVETAKLGGPGVHSAGLAADIRMYGTRAYDMIGLAIRLGFRGLGIQQQGAGPGRYVHLDTYYGDADQPRPTVWSYPG